MIYDQIVAIVKENLGDADKAADEIIEMLQAEGILNPDEEDDLEYEALKDSTETEHVENNDGECWCNPEIKRNDNNEIVQVIHNQ